MHGETVNFISPYVLLQNIAYSNTDQACNHTFKFQLFQIFRTWYFYVLQLYIMIFWVTTPYSLPGVLGKPISAIIYHAKAVSKSIQHVGHLLPEQTMSYILFASNPPIWHARTRVFWRRWHSINASI